MDYTQWWTGIQFEKVVLPRDGSSRYESKSGFYFYAVETGRLGLETAFRKIIAGPGRIIFCPAGVRRRFYSISGSVGLTTVRLRYRAFSVEVEADAEALDILMALARWTDRNGYVIPLTKEHFAELSNLLQRMTAEQLSDNPAVKLLLKSGVLQMLAEFSREKWLQAEWLPGRSAANAYSNIKRSLLYIEKNYTERISIADLARSARLSRSHFQAVFTQYTGLPAKEYLKRYRISVACRMLVTTNDSIAMIAFATGFGSVSQFYSAFKQQIKISPAQFRKQSGISVA